MRKQFFGLMLSTAFMAFHPALAMHEGINDESTKTIKLNISYHKGRTCRNVDDTLAWDVRVRPVTDGVIGEIKRREVVLFHENNKTYCQVANQDKIEIQRGLFVRVVDSTDDLNDLQRGEIVVFSEYGNYYYKVAGSPKRELPFKDPMAAVNKILGIETNPPKIIAHDHLNAYQMQNAVSSYPMAAMNVINDSARDTQDRKVEMARRVANLSDLEKCAMMFFTTFKDELPSLLSNIDSGSISESEETTLINYILVKQKQLNETILPSEGNYIRACRFDRLQAVLAGTEKEIGREDEEVLIKIACTNGVDYLPEEPKFSIYVGNKELGKVSLPLNKSPEPTLKPSPFRFKPYWSALKYEVKDLEFSFSLPNENLNDRIEFVVEGDMPLRNDGFIALANSNLFFSALPEIDGRSPKELFFAARESSRQHHEKFGNIVKESLEKDRKWSSVVSGTTFHIKINSDQGLDWQTTGYYSVTKAQDEQSADAIFKNHLSNPYYQSNRLSSITFTPEEVQKEPHLALMNDSNQIMRKHNQEYRQYEEEKKKREEIMKKVNGEK
jgi:hypothetical protein